MSVLLRVIKLEMLYSIHEITKLNISEFVLESAMRNQFGFVVTLHFNQ